MRKHDPQFDIPNPIQQWSSLVDVMHRLSPAAWKIVSLIARDDLMRQTEEASPIGALNRDMVRTAGIDTSKPTASEKRSGLTLVGDPKANWTSLSLAQICDGVVDRTKHKVVNRGIGSPKSSAIPAINEAVHLGILQKRTHKGPRHANLPTSYSINWERVAELARESKVWSNVKTSNKFGHPLRDHR